MSFLSQPFRSWRYFSRDCLMDQQPRVVVPIKSDFSMPPASSGDMRGLVLLRATRAGKLKATLPNTPNMFPANRHTVREQERDDRAMQRDITVSPSRDSQSVSVESRAEPVRSVYAVEWSSLSQRKPKATMAGPSTSATHWRSARTDTNTGLLGSADSPAEQATRKNPTAGALWTFRKIIQ